MLYILFILAAIISAIGFYKFVYFLSTGYAFSVVGLSLAILIMFKNNLNYQILVLVSLLAIYALRLGIFLFVREFKSKGYSKVMTEANESVKSVPLFVKIFIWLFCAALYVMQVSPVFFRLKNNLQNAYIGWLYVGIALILIGLITQTIADSQKSKAKSINPKRFCDIGLFKIVRCPNYFGEILVWTGVFVSSLPCLTGAFQIIFSSLGYLGIIFVMLSSTRRLELGQNKRYGNDKEYLEYIKSTPVLFPIIPLYSIANWKWLFI